MIESNLLSSKNSCLNCKLVLKYLAYLFLLYICIINYIVVNFIVDDFRKWCSSEDFNPMCLWFKNNEQESQYRNQTDPFYKYYSVTALILFTCMVAIQLLLIPKWVIVFCCRLQSMENYYANNFLKPRILYHNISSNKTYLLKTKFLPI